ncbi:helix-turn-helix domain-containing protein [Paenibacillus sp. CGMCC 1.16610]|uniref:Helix-turn-helix domain-containing protein n=1 Tax=Paenibacillus anseongense TaxID=2682845 RepID=A0ABW9U162_9BACL|nr:MULTISPECIES: helix-turn-helix domain-containing protein [Paenibacillus]MBA2936838.1 helix-turn-helix domain-containing protein [Paenibacillus sp. CGMCC 1.16610]MVQ33166.1 helix-turn-helix domain-containing protein [Paenibacillus anseongense]
MKAVIIDDEFWVRNSIRHLADWERLGISQVEEAEDGLSGLNIIAQIHPEIVITDMKMRGMDGAQLLQKISEDYPFIRKIVISGFDDFTYTKQAILSKVDEYLIKPINPEELNRALEKAVRELGVTRGIHAAKPLDKQLLKVITEMKHTVARHFQEMNTEAIKKSFKQLEQVLSDQESLQPGLNNSLYKQFMLLLEEQCALSGSELTSDAQASVSHFFVTDDTKIVEWIEVLTTTYVGILEALIHQRKNKNRINIDEIRKYLDLSYAEQVSLGTIANTFFVSKEHLSRVFKQEVGVTVMDYLIAKRMEKALELLQDASVSIKSAAEAVGYSDLTYFHRIFKKMTGMTPSQMRQDDE